MSHNTSYSVSRSSQGLLTALMVFAVSFIAIAVTLGIGAQVLQQLLAGVR